MCYSGYMTEDMVEQKEPAKAGPEGAVSTSGAQASDKNAERSYEVVAVIPIELFVPGNRKKVRKAINDPNGENSGEFVKVFPPLDIENPHSRIGGHIKDFSAYEYEIYEIRDKDPWSKAVCEIVNEEIENCKLGKDKIYAEKIKKELLNESKKDGKKWYLDIEIILAMPYVAEDEEKNNADKKKLYTADMSADDIADINKNTGIVISIQISVRHIEIDEKDENESNAAMAKFLKLIGDGLNRAINECPEKNVAKLRENKKIDGIFQLMVDLLPNDLFKNENGKDAAKDPLHNKIEINYVFIYFVCNGFDFHILTDTYRVDDNIKYSGDAWFLNKGKIYRNTINGKYISEGYYTEQTVTKNQHNNFVELPEHETHYWLTDALIPEATIRPKDIYYIPKINGGDRHDYSSVLLKFRNRLCCFVKGKYVDVLEADDKNRIAGMQIVLNSFWHRLIEFSRVMQKLCLASKTQEKENEGKEDNNVDTNLAKMSDMKPETRFAFLDQIYTTPTLPEQILDINSTDQDVLTLHDLAISSKIDSAASIFSEVKKNFLSLNTENINRERTKKAEKAEMGIQGMFLILALIASAIGLIELWADWNIDLWLEIFGTVLLFILVVGYLMWRYWGRRKEIYKRFCDYIKNIGDSGDS